jgi:ATP-dependent DNA helicase RecQ
MTQSSLQQVIKQHWGFGKLRPLQAEAMQAAIERRDSLVVMPTGGGKSLCYQAPALLADSPTVVVSPLIALMKDQVDQLAQRGIPAAYYNSTLTAADRRRVMQGIKQREFKLLFVAPERFANEGFLQALDQMDVGSVAIDEAHCISHWGHDFREDYRRLDLLKKRFNNISVHAFTATATAKVRQDIISQLGLVNPQVLVGDFFRPNLRYHVRKRSLSNDDIVEEIKGRQGQAGIVYCIRRKDVEMVAADLQRAGVTAIGYHAGMSDERRTAAQEAFANREINVVVATIAFGMGIDRPDIRFVIHGAMPKTIEHYQQETGRAGRDGEPADCILFYENEDYHTWEFILEKGCTDPKNLETQRQMLGDMFHFASGLRCRHRSLVEYFGQAWERDHCHACDICLGSASVVPDSTVVAQKILSAVARTQQRYGAAYVADVLRGEATDKVLERRHGDLSVFGLLKGDSKKRVMSWINQLIDQKLLVRDGEYRVLKLTHAGLRVMKSEAETTLLQASETKSKRKRKRSTAPPPGLAALDKTPTSRAAQATPQPLDSEARQLYESLRQLRREIADENNIPAFVVFSDKTLREIARNRPTTIDDFTAIKGIGPAKSETYGRQFLDCIRETRQES